MADWLPSLNALRAFEAVCRHLNYAHAAEELRVTPAAVKQLVQKLEDALGTPLVKRRGRGLELTREGRAGVEGLSRGFAQISKAVGRMRPQDRRQRLIVSAEPSFATTWLVPRLSRFRQAHEEIDVLIDSSLRIVDLERGEADVAIRFGAAPDRRLITRRLFDERICALCSPSLVSGPPRLHKLDDLRHATLLHWDTSDLTWAVSTRDWMDWQSWLAKAGAAEFELQRQIVFGDYNLALQAAIAGQGLVLGSYPILRDIIDAKLLVDPFDVMLDTSIGYDVVMTEEACERPQVRSFADWIASESRQAA
jgi:LysR family glycine cleavage system transcriptional activator